MYSHLAMMIVAGIIPTCTAAELTGEQRAQTLLKTAKQHLGVHDATRSVGTAPGIKRRGFIEIRYETPQHVRFATYRLALNGGLKEFVVNAPDVDAYVPVKKRRAFIERMMEIVAPCSSQTERAWGANELDTPWTQRVRPIPVQVGEYVFRGGTTSNAEGFHDTFWIVAANTGYVALKYRPKQ